MGSNYTINHWINTQINVDMMIRYGVINVCSSRQSSEAKLDRQESLSETHRDTESPVLDQQSPAVPQWVSPAPPCLSPTTSPGIVSQGEAQLVTHWCHPPHPYSWHQQMTNWISSGTVTHRKSPWEHAWGTRFRSLISILSFSSKWSWMTIQIVGTLPSSGNIYKFYSLNYSHLYSY